MSNTHTLELTEDNFEAQVLQADMPVLVDFFGTHCPPCRVLEPVIHEIAAEYAGRARVGTVSVEDHPRLAVDYGVGGVPTVIVFKGGQIATTFTGIVAKEKLAAALDSAQ